jgi:hypothetical protein
MHVKQLAGKVFIYVLKQRQKKAAKYVNGAAIIAIFISM